MTAGFKDKRKKTGSRGRSIMHVIPWILCVTAFVMALSVGCFLIYTLVLKTNYKDTALKINESFKPENTVRMSRGGEAFTLPASDVEYYDIFLLNRNTVVFSRKSVPETDETIVLDFGGKRLSFTGLEDGSAISIEWKTSTEEKHYVVRSETTFMQLKAYYMNCLRKADNQ